MLRHRFIRSWYAPTPSFWNYLLLPLTLIFSVVVVLRRGIFQRFYRLAHREPVPIVVVGNLTVGGTGKTPLVIFLANYLRKQGYRPGIVSRGYKSSNRFCQEVLDNSDPTLVGDEPVVIARQTGVPIVVCKNRMSAVHRLFTQHRCNVILSDDGLQHYAMPHDIEVLVVDGIRRFGNQWCLPAGPLREPLQRLRDVDFIVCNSGEPLEGEYRMQVEGHTAINLVTGERQDLSYFADKQVHAVAGIGHPGRFFSLLKQCSIDFIPHAFNDHHQYQAIELTFKEALPIVMTEKDAVKCMAFASKDMWMIPITAKISEPFVTDFMRVLTEVSHQLGKRL